LVPWLCHFPLTGHHHQHRYLFMSGTFSNVLAKLEHTQAQPSVRPHPIDQMHSVHLRKTQKRNLIKDGPRSSVNLLGRPFFPVNVFSPNSQPPLSSFFSPSLAHSSHSFTRYSLARHLWKNVPCGTTTTCQPDSFWPHRCATTTLLSSHLRCSSPLCSSNHRSCTTALCAPHFFRRCP